jgi:hypothetical protein
MGEGGGYGVDAVGGCVEIDVTNRLMKSDCYLQHVMRIRELQEYVKVVRGLYGLREEKREGRREEGVME